MFVTGYDLSKKHSKPIRANYVTLSEKLDIDSGLLGYLYTTDVISSAEKESIQSERNLYIRRQRLLSLILMKSAKGFNSFIKALDATGQCHLAAILSGKAISDRPITYKPIIGITDFLIQLSPIMIQIYSHMPVQIQIGSHMQSFKTFSHS